MNVSRKAALTALCLVAAQSAGMVAIGAEPLPEFYGFYALDKGQLYELTESSNALEGDFSPQVRFILFEKSVGLSGLLAGEVRLSRYKFVRNVREPADLNDLYASSCVVRAENKWKATEEAERQVELRAKPVPGQAEMIILVPREPLPPGGYLARTDQGDLAKFFVDKGSLFANLESTDDCVDEERFVAGGISGFMQRINNSSTEIACRVSTLKAGSIGPCSTGSSTAPVTPGAVTPGEGPMTAGASPASASTESIAGRWEGRLSYKGTLTSFHCGAILQVDRAGVGQDAAVIRTNQGGRPYSEIAMTFAGVADGQYVLKWDPSRRRCFRPSGACGECDFFELRLSPVDERTLGVVSTKKNLTYEGMLERR